MSHSHFVDCFVFCSFVDSEDVRKRFQIPNDMDAVLMFNENTTYPMASVTMKDIPTSTLNHIISSNQYLALPRLSSQVSIYLTLRNKSIDFIWYHVY